ncbi:Zinc finger CCHC-type [Arabidopsis thaliana x Arabidopsis arenosa]|uniref:Zinc finger CCHC-type n=1 Tax=Arabidopsis thaliana x Arabidopsis arenosa TaxID=1240361 RepID=A0A8T2BGS5_9BRAS|nr:Zinc finger CCHC-type [Arabidopsis thaliana x Arabidopsis arenosa]
MSTSENNSEMISVNTNTIHHIKMSNISKLTTHNYLTWKLQVHSLLDGYELVHHLDESKSVPPATITEGTTTSTNPDYTKWRRQDKLIYSALIGSLSSSVQPIVGRTTTAAQIWTKLANTYANPSRTHIRNVKDQLKLYTKGSKSVDEYIQGIVTRFDQLALLGSELEHDDQIEHILDGLPEEFKPVIDQIAAKDTPPQITEVHEKLLNYEAKLLSKSQAALSTFSPVTANVVQHNNNNNGNQQNNNRNNNNGKRYNNYNNSWNSNQYQQRSDSRVSKPYLGKCQYCNTQGHSARRCPQLQALQMSTPPPANPFRPWQPRANVAVGSPYILDSGATHHLTADLNNLSLHQPYNGGDDVMIADGSTMTISHTGSALLPNQTRSLLLDKILCVPDIQKNLISVYRLCNTNQVSVEFFPASFQVKDLSTGVPLLQGRTKNELYEWPVTSSQAVAMVSSSGPKASLINWHSRLGHPSSSVLQTIISKFLLPISSSSQKQQSCSDCLINKTHKLPFSQTSIVSHRPLEYIFTDVWTSPIHSVDNHKYYLVLVDHFTRYTWLYPLLRKSDVKSVFTAFKALVENKFQNQIGTLFSDNGGEFVALRSFLSNAGITHLTSPPHTPEHNGLAERKHRHIVETGLTLMSTASVPKEYWSYAFSTAVYLINRMPTPLLSMQSPFQKLFGSPPNYEKLRVFGCLCFPWLRPYTRHKLEDRSQRCVFIGYSTSQSAYFCLHPPTARVYVSRHVQFDEETFPFKASQPPHRENVMAEHPPPSMIPITQLPVMPPSSVTAPPLPTTGQLGNREQQPLSAHDEEDGNPIDNVGQLQTGPTFQLNQAQSTEAQSTEAQSTEAQSTESQSTEAQSTETAHQSTVHHRSPHTMPSSTTVPTMESPASSPASPPLETGSPRLDLHPPSSPSSHTQVSSSNPSSSSSPFSEPTAHSENGSQTSPQPIPNPLEPTAPRQNELNPTTQLQPQTKSNPRQAVSQPQNQNRAPPQNIHNMKTRAKNNITKPNQKLSLTVAANLHRPPEPTTIVQALKDKNWSRACSSEFDALMGNHTWDLVPPHAAQNIVGCKWVFTTKYLSNGLLERYKARLVAKGFHQQYGKDYAETFSPVIKSTTIRLVLDVATAKNWPIKQLDVNNAFLQGELTEEVYMSQPPGFVDKDRPSYVCRLHKPIYGLKQAPRAWYMALKQFLLSSGFTNSMADTSLFILSSGSTITYVLVYVDDILVTGDNAIMVSNVLASFADRFSIKDPTDLHYFLGIEVTRSPRGLHLMQRKYIMDLLNKNNMLDAKPVTTPLPTTPKLTLLTGEKLPDASQYRSVVGSLQYLSFTRPDIAYAVNRLSQFVHQPTDAHWNAAKRVLRYLAGTPTHGIQLTASSPMTLHAFSDADWAGDTEDYVSTNGYLIYLGRNPISWSSKKQRGVARSSTESEYRAVANTAAEVRWLCSLLFEMKISLPTAPVIYCDNIGATYLCANPVFHSRMKHIALDYHFVRNQIQDGMLRVSHVSTDDQLADTLTKPLSRSRFQQACIKIGVAKLPPS